MQRTVSDNGVNFTAAWEEFKPRPYFATEKERAKRLWTWGFGHTGMRPPNRDITLAEAHTLLRDDLANAVAVVNSYAPDTLTQAQFDAMCDLVFNVGPGAIYKVVDKQRVLTGTGQALKAGDTITLRRKLPQFINQGGVPMLGLRRRAAGRLALFNGETWRDAEKIGRASA